MGTLSRSGPSYYVHLWFLQTLPVQPWGLSELKKAKTKTKTIQVYFLLY